MRSKLVNDNMAHGVKELVLGDVRCTVISYTSSLTIAYFMA